jgi:hypothetical protein
MSCEKTLKGSYGNNSTITRHPLKVKTPEHKAFLQYAEGKKPEQIIQDQFVDSVYTMVEVRDSPKTKAQTKFLVSKAFIDKVIGDKIEITQQKQTVDVNKLLDQLTTLRGLCTANLMPKIELVQDEDKETEGNEQV